MQALRPGHSVCEVNYVEKKKLSGLICDLLAILGAALISIGAGLIYLPAGLIVGGSLCVVSAIVAARAFSGGDDS